MKNKLTGKEKHFYKLKIRFQKELNSLIEINKKIIQENYALQNEITKSKKQIGTISAELEYLKSKLNLSDEEIKQLISSSKVFNDIGNLLGIAGSYKKFI